MDGVVVVVVVVGEDRDLLLGWLLMSCRCNTCHSLGFTKEKRNIMLAFCFVASPPPPLRCRRLTRRRRRRQKADTRFSNFHHPLCPPSYNNSHQPSNPPVGSRAQTLSSIPLSLTHTHCCYLLPVLLLLLSDVLYCRFIIITLRSFLSFSLKDSMIIYRLVFLSARLVDSAMNRHFYLDLPCRYCYVYSIVYNRYIETIDSSSQSYRIASHPSNTNCSLTSSFSLVFIATNLMIIAGYLTGAILTDTTDWPWCGRIRIERTQFVLPFFFFLKKRNGYVVCWW